MLCYCLLSVLNLSNNYVPDNFYFPFSFRSDNFINTYFLASIIYSNIYSGLITQFYSVCCIISRHLAFKVRLKITFRIEDLYVIIQFSTKIISFSFVFLYLREVYHTSRMQRVFCVTFSGDATYVLSGSDETNIR